MKTYRLHQLSWGGFFREIKIRVPDDLCFCRTERPDNETTDLFAVVPNTPENKKWIDENVQMSSVDIGTYYVVRIRNVKTDNDVPTISLEEMNTRASDIQKVFFCHYNFDFDLVKIYNIRCLDKFGSVICDEVSDDPFEGEYVMTNITFEHNADFYDSIQYKEVKIGIDGYVPYYTMISHVLGKMGIKWSNGYVDETYNFKSCAEKIQPRP